MDTRRKKKKKKKKKKEKKKNCTPSLTVTCVALVNCALAGATGDGKNDFFIIIFKKSFLSKTREDH